MLGPPRHSRGSGSLLSAVKKPMVKAKGAAVRAGSESLRAQLESATQQHRQDVQYLNAIKQFEAASLHFQKHRYAKAKEVFQKLSSVPYLEIADRARLHCHLCEQKLTPPAAPVKRVDHYLLGVAELNVRNVELAIEHLTKAARSAPDREHVRYALAAAHAVHGNADLALEHLRAAVQLRPENSFQARHDEDFRSLTGNPVFRSLIGADGWQSVPTTA